MYDAHNRMAILVRNTKNLFSLWYHSQLIVILSRTRIIKNNNFVHPKKKKRADWNFSWIKKLSDVNVLMKYWRSKMLTQITILNLQLLWINPDFHFEFVIYQYHNIKLGLFFLTPQTYTSYLHILSTLRLRTTLIRYNVVGYASSINIVIYLKPFFLLFRFVLLEMTGK